MGRPEPCASEQCISALAQRVDRFLMSTATLWLTAQGLAGTPMTVRLSCFM
jgi:hypothetical protein